MRKRILYAFSHARKRARALVELLSRWHEPHLVKLCKRLSSLHRKEQPISYFPATQDNSKIVRVLPKSGPLSCLQRRAVSQYYFSATEDNSEMARVWPKTKQREPTLQFCLCSAPHLPVACLVVSRRVDPTTTVPCTTESAPRA